ncbi:RNA-binding protein 34-like [Cydia strobilella]|uniref:RNA-binding protein 34-like n=1 Tax=Cydia strobilella TaxID=1100964 RepID=UPI0030077392
MGEPQSRKRKFKGNTKANNNEVRDVEVTAEDINENEVSKVTKKAKKNKLVEKPADINENDISDAKTKKMKFVTSNKEAVCESDLNKPKKKRAKKNKDNKSGDRLLVKTEKISDVRESSKTVKGGLTEEMLSKYPILKDKELVERFMAVSMSNNQKGRVRSTFRDRLKGTSDAMLADVIHTKMQAILKLPEQTDSALRKLRILYNMLKTAVKGKKFIKKEPVKKIQEVKKIKENKDEKEDNGADESKKDKKQEQKVKGPKRYVVFIGNLPLDISKDKISEHFSDLSSQIVSVRIPKPLESKKSAIAYLELKDEISYELSLSKHHSMLDNKRINVLYSTQKNSKISKTEAKGKAAKLVAMQKSGQLAGSISQNKKRSARRKKMKLAQKAQEAERGV